MAEPDVDNLQPQLVVLVIEGDEREIDVVVLSLRIQARRGAERVVRLLYPACLDVGLGEEIVQLRRLHAFGDQRLTRGDGRLGFATFDEHEHVVVGGCVPIPVCRLRPGEEARRIRVGLALPEDDAGIEGAARIPGRERVEERDGIGSAVRGEQTGSVVKRPVRMVEGAIAGLLEVDECRRQIAAGERHLGDVHVRDGIARDLPQDALEMGGRGVVPAERELVHREVLPRRVEVGIDREGRGEARVGFVETACARERDPEQIQGPQVARRPGEPRREQLDGRRELVPLDVGRGAVERAARALRGRPDAAGRAGQQDHEARDEQARHEASRPPGAGPAPHGGCRR